MKTKNIVRESRTDWNRVKTMSDSDIDLSDVPKLDKAFFRHVQIRMPKRKESVSLRVDPDVLQWFRRQGHGYQTRINAILRAYVEVHQH